MYCFCGKPATTQQKRFFKWVLGQKAWFFACEDHVNTRIWKEEKRYGKRV